MRDIKKEILKKLEEIEQQEKVKVLYAVESGSRAWGVESPDSDYDVRFVYVRTIEDYLSLQEKRDVIEWQLDEVLDINGWDLRKTLIQFRKGNATLFEWANSPVVYKSTDAWEQISEVGKKYFAKKTALNHYYGTANSTFCRFLQGEAVKYKKYIYALRPLLACKYIEQYENIPPVKFEDLLKQSLPKELMDEIQIMLTIKANSDEKDLNPGISVIHNYIQEELRRYEQISKEMKDDRLGDWSALNQVFLQVLEKETTENETTEA